VLADRHMQAAVASVALQARAEDGVARACDVIEKVLDHA
jgi:UDP:flavonoid glycosyltransferase YjiC (YdhE family)